MLKSVWPVMVGLLLFILCYFDEYSFGGVKVGIIWRGALTVLLALECLKAGRGRILPVLLVGVLVAVKGLIYYYHSAPYLIADAAEQLKFLMFPLALQYLWMKHRSGRHSLIERWSVFVGLWIPMSVVPFLFGLPQLDNKESHSLERFGVVDAFEFSGVFGNKTVACVTLAICVILLFHLRKQSLIRFSTYISMVSLCVIGMYMTYSRTGMLALLLSFAYLLVFGSKNWIAAITKTGAFFLAAAALIVALYMTDEVFAMRLLGQNVYAQEASIEQLGSGRTLFWQNALKNPLEDGAFSALSGHGLQYSMDLMERDVGLRIFSHNGFLDAYQNSGLIGFALFIAFYCAVYLHIRTRVNLEIRRTALALFWFTVFVQMTQGGFFFWSSIVFALVLTGGKFERNGQAGYV